MAYYILEDDGFILKTWLIKPYFMRRINRAERKANYRISRGSRRVTEDFFGVISSRFRLFKEAILLHPERSREVLMAYIVLHNMLRCQKGPGDRPWRDMEDEVAPGG